MEATSANHLRLAMLSIHSCPLGELGTTDTGGMSVYIRALARELGRRGHRVDIFTRSHHPDHQALITLSPGVRLFHVPTGGGKLHRNLGGFFRRLQRLVAAEGRGYNLIHSHYWLSGRVGLWAQQAWSCPHVAMFHTLGAAKARVEEPEEQGELRIATERRIGRDCHLVLATSRQENLDLQRLYGVQPEKIALIPGGVDQNLFRPQERAWARKRLGIAGDEPLLLFVGRFVALKGIDILLRAVAIMRSRQQVRLLLVGGDDTAAPEIEPYRSLAQRLGLGRAAIFAGRVEHQQLPLYYNAADVVVVPSLYESFGLVALEALASGTPVVATRVGAMEEIVQDRKTGVLVCPGEPRKLADGVNLALRLGKTVARHQLVASADPFAWPRIAARVEEEYRRLLLPGAENIIFSGNGRRAASRSRQYSGSQAPMRP